MVVQRFGAWRAGIERRALRAPLSLVYVVLHRYVRNHYGIEIHDTTTVGPRCRLGHQSGIVIHEQAVIGADCRIRQGVTIGQVSGSTERSGAPTIGDRVEIGANAVIVGPIVIGDDVIIAPNALVLRDVPSGCTVSGPPARVFPREPAEASEAT
jgi:serine O-acetyltransferase